MNMSVKNLKKKIVIFFTDTGIPSKPRELMHQDLYHSFEQDETGVLACNVQSTPPPAFRYY